MTYAEWHTQYLALYRRNLAAKTLDSYSRIHDLIAPIIGGIPLDAVTPDHIQQALNAVADQAGTRQAQIAYALLHASLQRAMRSGHINRNPADMVDKPDHDATPGRAITGDDWETLQPIITGTMPYALMCLAGLRRGECLGLCWGDVDLRSGLLHVRRSLVRVHHQLVMQAPKSRAGVRDVPITPDLMQMLRAEYRFDPDKRVVNLAPETLAHHWRADQLEAGIQQPYRLHDLRHTYATRLALAGCNMRVLQYMIGHADYSLTMQTYTHIGAAEAIAEVKRIASNMR